MTHSLRHRAHPRDGAPPGRGRPEPPTPAHGPAAGAVATGLGDWPSAPAVPSDLSRPGLQRPGCSPVVLRWTRHRRLLAALMAVVVVGAVPLSVQHSLDRSLLSTDGGPSSFPGEQVHRRSATGDEVRVAYQQGGPYEFAFTLTNDSRWPVRILGFPTFDGVLSQRSIAIDWTPLADDDARPFRPFTLGAEDSVLVRMRAQFAHCDRYPAGGSAMVHHLPVRYRALWVTRTRSLGLPTTIDVPVPSRGGCSV